MQFHFEDTAENYFANTLKRLETEQPEKGETGTQATFIDLKIMEYWVRFMRAYPNGCCRVFCDSYMTDRFAVEFADHICEIRQQISFPKAVTAKIDDDSYGMQELVDKFLETRDVRIARQIFQIMAYFDGSNDCVRSLLVQVIERCTTDWIKRGCVEGDISLQRLFDLKKIFHLDYESVELVAYLWLRNHQRMFMKLDSMNIKEGMDFDSYERGTFQRIALLTGLTPTAIQKLCSKDGPLVRFQLVQMEESYRNMDHRINRKELYLSNEVSDYLYGFSDMSHIMNYKPAEPPLVPFERIAEQNGHATLVLQMLQNHEKGTPLNILFYGREGTGKTELAKALAQKLDVPLLSVGMGEESMDEESLLHHRLRSLLLAEWDCQKSGGFILMDESDLVLNKAEKGLLNTLFENLKVPVIWITNSIASIENSTRRRFDYAMEFSKFGKRERVAIWQSVLKTQNAESLLDAELVEKIATEMPVMAGSATLAVKMAKRIVAENEEAANAFEPQQVIREVALSHAKLLGIQAEWNSPTTASIFREDYIRFSGDVKNPLRYIIPLLQNFDAKLRQGKESGTRENLSMLLFGPPGTGKTAFANHVARDILHRDILVKRASDILGGFVGETEQNIRDIFREAEKNNAILFIDEADSFLEARDAAQHRWEVSQVNEFICQMDAFTGLFIAATNFERTLDKAIRRRFQLKLGFECLEKAQVKKIWSEFFGGTCPAVLLEQGGVSISDFATVNQKLRYMPDNLKNSELAAEYMLDEIANKDDHFGRRLGL
jgi:SpoVK/Ycf46/Vps4 family AAA+-type ATPase